MTSTPETDAIVREELDRIRIEGISPAAFAARLTLKCEDLERERDRLRSEIERLQPREMSPLMQRVWHEALYR